MAELDLFIKRAKSTLGANGSAFVTYDEFLKLYKKDNDGMDFEQEARKIGYSNGRQAILCHQGLFEMQGDRVRRIECKNTEHIVRAIDNSKRPKKKFTNAPRGRGFFPISNLIGVHTSTPTNRYSGYSRGHNLSGPRGKRFFAFEPSSVFTNKSLVFANEPMELPSVVASTLANKPVGTDSSFNSVSMPIVPSEQTRKTTSSEDRRNGGTTSNTLTSDLIIPGSLKSSKKGDVPGSSVGNQIFSSVSIMEPSRSNMELPPAVEPIRSTNKPLWTPKSKPDTSKGYAHRYSVPPMVPLSFNAKSTTSKGHESEEPGKQTKDSRLEEPRHPGLSFSNFYPCRILDIDTSSAHVVLSVRPLHWDDVYHKLTEDLRRFGVLFEIMEPVKSVSKRDRVLKRDESTRSFHRCYVLSDHVDDHHQIVELYLPDEAKKCSANMKDLYRMPTRFNAYHDMSFVVAIEGLKLSDIKDVVEMLQKCASVDHQIDIMLTISKGFNEGALNYGGKMLKIRAEDLGLSI